MSKPKVCLVCEKYQLNREYLSVHTALEKRFDLTRYFVDDGWPARVDQIADYKTYDAFIWYVRFRELITRPAFDWRQYAGLRIMYDFDAYQNFSLLAGDRYLGAWPKVFNANKFDVLICTGKAVRDNLRESGVNAVWIPKGFDRSKFYDQGKQRDGNCYFGELYNARIAMLDYLERRQVPVTRFKCSFFELNDYLNKFQICLICNMVGIRRKGMSGLWNRLPMRPFAAELHPGPEVMQKNFEVAASGCVPFCDEIAELDDLGFKDGETMVSYRNFDELAQKLEWYERSPDRLREISKSAAALCLEFHTWEYRAELFADVVEGHALRPIDAIDPLLASETAEEKGAAHAP